MISEKFSELISLIKNLTIEDTMKWERTSNPLEFLSTTIRPYAVGIYKSDDSYTNNPAITFYIMDEHGSVTLRQTEVEKDKVDYAMLRSLYECIDSKDEKTTQFLDEFLRKLKVEKAS